MGPRKFTLSRKKRFSREPSVHRKIDLATLCRNIKDAELGEWSFISTPPADTIRLCKFNSMNPPTATMTLDVTHPTMKWSLYVGDRSVSIPREESVPSNIYAVTDLMMLLDTIDRFHSCMGINDKKFAPLIKTRKSFYTQQGKNKLAIITL